MHPRPPPPTVRVFRTKPELVAFLRGHYGEAGVTLDPRNWYDDEDLVTDLVSGVLEGARHRVRPRNHP